MSLILRKRGRPPGAKTKAETPGKKRARQYLDLKFDNSLRSTKAASIVADKNSVSTEQIFKDAKRHESSLADELMRDVAELKRHYEAEVAAWEMGPHQPTSGAAVYFHAFGNALKGYWLD